MTKRASQPQHLTFRGFAESLCWLDGRPLVDMIEPYRWRIFEQALDEYDGDRPRYNAIISGRAKKNWKTTDLVLAALYCLFANDSPGGNQIYIVANDEDQAGDDLELAKKLIEANPVLAQHVTIRKRVIERKDGKGFIEVLAAGDVVGLHGKTYRFVGFDEIHGTARGMCSKRTSSTRPVPTRNSGSRVTRRCTTVPACRSST